MRLALAQGRRALGRTFPNPSVGAVVYRGDRILGRGRTRPVGGPHAETVAIANALRRFGSRALRGAAMAVTLEPCCHVGRTGPCTDAIIAAGIRRVCIGHGDPHPEVAGRGVRKLRRGGATVEVGVLKSECRELHRGFFFRGHTEILSGARRREVVGAHRGVAAAIGEHNRPDEESGVG